MARIVIDTGDVAASYIHDMGKWNYICPDEKVLEITEAFIKLGFTPEVIL